MSGWVAWLVGCLVLAALVSAGIVVAAGDDRPGEAVVSATADRPGTAGVTSTFTVPLPVTSPPSPTTTRRTTTTLSPAAVAVLRAIASTTTTTGPPTTSSPTTPPPTTAPPTTRTTTAPPAPTTTVTTTTQPAPTTTTTIAPRFVVTLVNDHPNALVLTLNGQDFSLAPGQTRPPVELPVAADGKDTVVVRAPSDGTCGATDTGALFPSGSRWRLRIVAGEVMCTDFPRPRLEISPL